jgi:hypothetical protein
MQNDAVKGLGAPTGGVAVHDLGELEVEGIACLAMPSCFHPSILCPCSAVGKRAVPGPVHCPHHLRPFCFPDLWPAERGIQHCDLLQTGVHMGLCKFWGSIGLGGCRMIVCTHVCMCACAQKHTFKVHNMQDTLVLVCVDVSDAGEMHLGTGTHRVGHVNVLAPASPTVRVRLLLQFPFR